MSFIKKLKLILQIFFLEKFYNNYGEVKLGLENIRKNINVFFFLK